MVWPVSQIPFIPKVERIHSQVNMILINLQLEWLRNTHVPPPVSTRTEGIHIRTLRERVRFRQRGVSVCIIIRNWDLIALWNGHRSSGGTEIRHSIDYYSLPHSFRALQNLYFSSVRGESWAEELRAISRTYLTRTPTISRKFLDNFNDFE